MKDWAEIPIQKRKTAILNTVLMSLPGVMVICWSFTTHRIMTTNIPTGVIVIYPLKRFIRQNIKSSLNQKHRPALFCLLSIKPTASFIQATPMMKDVCWLMRFWVMPETRNPSSDCLLPTSTLRQCKNHCRIYNLTINFAV